MMLVRNCNVKTRRSRMKGVKDRNERLEIVGLEVVGSGWEE